MKNKHLIAVIAGMMLVAFLVIKTAEAGGDGYSAQSCTASSSNIVIGDDISTKILATSSRRAWARIQVGNNATNTVSLMLNDVTAVHNQGILLNQANTGGASSTPFLDFGLNTDLPYTGAIKAITNFSTTSVNVTQCLYNR